MGTTEHIRYICADQLPDIGRAQVKRWELVVQLTGGGACIMICEDDPASKLVRDLRKLASTIERDVRNREQGEPAPLDDTVPTLCPVCKEPPTSVRRLGANRHFLYRYEPCGCADIRQH